MYTVLLSLHNLTRWIALILLISIIFKSYIGWKRKQEYSSLDNNLRISTVSTLHIQALFGLCLYYLSPVVKYFWSDFGNAVKLREIRFFGMEHITVMLIAIIILSIGNIKVKKEKETKFKKQFIWFGSTLLLIISSIPWSFSPLTHRPDFRWWF